MPISFSNIPQNLKVPLYWVELDPSMAGLPTINLRALLVGCATPDASQPMDVAVPIGSLAMAEQFFGPQSELARMFRAFYKNNFANEVWGLPVAEPTGGTAATGTITVTAPPTAAGTLHFYVAGTYVPVNVGSTDTITQIAQAITDAFNAQSTPTIPVTAVIGTLGAVDVTATFKGVNGNEIQISLNYYGGRGGQQLPPGVAVTLPVGTGQNPPVGFLSGGAGTPVWATAITNLGETPFEYICLPYTDSQTLFDWGQEMSFGDSGRWGWARQLFGHLFAAKRGEYPDLVLWGEQFNDPILSVMAFETNSPSPAFEWAAGYTAKAQRALINDAARPLQSLALNDIKLAPFHQRFNFPELNSLASNGLAIQEAGTDQQPMILREQTTYQLNLFGAPDDAYELVTTLATLAKLMRNQKHMVTSQFPRMKLADDGTRFGPGQAIVTPGIIKSALISQYQQDMYNGLCENLSAFKQHLLVERDPNDPNRVNVLYPPDLINQLRIFAVLNQFRLQYDRGVDFEIIGQAQGPFNAANQSP